VDFSSHSDNLIVMDGKAVVARFKKGRFSTDDRAVIAAIQRACPDILSSGDSAAPSGVSDSALLMCECGAGPFKSKLARTGHCKSAAHLAWVADNT
jgi:hypothetical protein